MITGKARAGAALALAGLLALAVWQWRAEIRNAAQWAVGFEQLEQSVRELEREARMARDNARRMEALEEAMADDLRALRQETQARDEAYRQLEREDEDYRSWARQRLPDAVLERRGMRDPAHSGGTD